MQKESSKLSNRASKVAQKKECLKSLKKSEEVANGVAPARNGVPGTKLQSCLLRVLTSGNM